MEYRIGDFAVITRMSIKMLRNYHENGLLVPVRIDGDSGYRYYSESQIRQAAIINTLKNWNFSLKEIGEILVQCHEDRDLVDIVRNKQKEVREKIRKLRGIESDLSLLIAAEEEREKMKTIETNEITARDLDDLAFISITYRGAFSECGKYFGKLFRIAGRKAAGPPFNMYSREIDTENPEVRVCVPVKGKIEAGEAEYSLLSGVKVISTIHKGPYERVGEAYKRLIDYRDRSSLEQGEWFREIYIKGPGMIFAGNPEKYVTEVQMFLA